MNFKVFSIIVGILIAVIAILGGTYYYLFEYSKPKNYGSNTPSYTQQNSYPNHYDNTPANQMSQNVLPNNNFNTTQETSPQEQSLNSNTYLNTSEENNQSLNSLNSNISTNTTSENNQSFNLSGISENNASQPTISANSATPATPITPVSENNQSSNSNTQSEKTQTSKQEHKQAKIEALKKEISKQQKILEREKAVKKELESDKSNKNKYLSTAREYLSIGKNSRLEPELSTENMKVYVLDGKFLSQYRINLLKDMLSVIEENSKDYYLSIFVKMLPKGEMKLSIYNKEIIFSDMKKAYKYITLESLSPYLNNPQSLNAHIAREEILERLKLQIKKESKGSEFSKHIKSLKTGLYTAQYFFPFCEIIEITSIK